MHEIELGNLAIRKIQRGFHPTNGHIGNTKKAHTIPAFESGTTFVFVERVWLAKTTSHFLLSLSV